MIEAKVCGANFCLDHILIKTKFFVQGSPCTPFHLPPFLLLGSPETNDNFPPGFVPGSPETNESSHRFFVPGSGQYQLSFLCPLFAPPFPLLPIQPHTHQRNQFIDFHRFRNIVIRARFKAFCPIIFHRFCRQGDNR